MQQIEQDIYLNDAYFGVTVGALTLPQGTILVDAPPHPEDGRGWQAIINNLSHGGNRMLIALDDHPDRCIGLRMMDSTVLVHEKTAEIISDRPAIFKAQNHETGADWENCEGLTGIRWAKPDLTFTDHAILNWGEYPIYLEHHPGPAPGATWLVIPDINVVFIGDTVTLNQPPFLAVAEIPDWIESIDLLLSKKFKRYLMISSRGGVVSIDAIREQRRFLREVEKQMERLHSRGLPPEETASLVPKLLTRFDFHPRYHLQYSQRLKYGLFEFYVRHYAPPQPEEE